MLWVASKIRPMMGVKIAPPMTAITISDPPIFVFGPSPFNPSAKIVGNISDMKKLVRKIAQRPIQPGSSDLTGGFCTSGSEREFTLEGSWYADEEIQAGTDRDTAAAG